jgi:uncharacterized protein (TIGR00255 family)
MPVYSMTGYATLQGGGPAPAPGAPLLGLEIRSVNSRFLDLSLRLPDELRAAEPALRERIAAQVRRGKVELRAWVEGRADQALRPPVHTDLQRLLAAQEQVQAWLPAARGLSVAEALQLVSRQTPVASGLTEALLTLVDPLLEDFQTARAREGTRLAAMLQDRVGQLRALAQQAQPLIPALVEQQRLRFLERWQEALGGAQADPAAAHAQERALTEATAYAIRIDVAEELTRLQSHLDEIERLLGRGGEAGKRLDFLIQELHREANTLGSKSSSLELTRISVDMKILIEQLREQVQNIE